MKFVVVFYEDTRFRNIGGGKRGDFFYHTSPLGHVWHFTYGFIYSGKVHPKEQMTVHKILLLLNKDRPDTLKANISNNFEFEMYGANWMHTQNKVLGLKKKIQS